ncbi:MAG: transporter substrate-binding domain-containing protein [Desulfobacter sp.]|nr:MAG: transporter substrate-binding domain-containing protein [Desulfobacter sp.]
MMAIRIKILCVLFIILMLSASANAETYIFAGGDFPLLSEKNKDGDIRGIAVDIARKITERLGHRIIVRLYPWARAQHMVKNGIADVLFPPYKTPEREKWLDYTKRPFAKDETFFFVRQGSQSFWNGDLASLRGKKIGMVLKWSVGPDFEKAKKSLSIEYVPNIDMCFRMLIQEYVDFVPTQLREAKSSFKRLNLTDKQLPLRIFPKLTINYNYFGFSKKKQKELSGFKRSFDQALERMHKNGEILEILTAYGMSN